MSTFVAMEYCFKLQSFSLTAQRNLSKTSPSVSKPLQHTFQPKIVFLVLDTPFESVKLMIKDCIQKLKSDGYEIPETLVSFFSGLARRIISNQLKADPYTVEPIKFAAKINLPVLILSSTGDDYIPAHQSLRVFESWLGPKKLHVMSASHFQQRPLEIVEVAINSMRILVSEVNTLSSTNPESSSNSKDTGEKLK